MTISWTTQTSPNDNNWNNIIYGNGIFVAVSVSGTGNRIMTSSDGITWTARTSPADNNWRSVVYGNNKFVAVANTGTNRIMTSSDGVSWSLNSFSTTNNWESITYGNGLFVAVATSGTGNRVMTSSDGSSWTLRNSTSDIQWNSVTYGNNMFVAVASGGSVSSVMTSVDGINWIACVAGLNSFHNTYNWQSVTYGNGKFVAVASSGTVGLDACMVSSDGIIWKLSTTPSNNAWMSVSYCNGIFASVSSFGSGNRIMTSPDGITWTAGSSPADNGWVSVTCGNGIFVAISNTGTGNRIMTSSTVVAPTLSLFSIPTKIIGDASFNIVAPTSTSNGAFSYASSNTSIATVSGSKITVVGPGSCLITATQAGTTSYESSSITAPFKVDTFSSVPTSVWTTLTSPDVRMYSVAYGNGLYAVVTNLGTGIRVLTSVDGSSWLLRNSPVDNDWRSITYGFDPSGNGIFVSVSNNGTGNRVMTSYDGITWTVRTSAADNSWNQVVYGTDPSGNGIFVAVAASGTGNRVMTSYNGITWTSRTSAADNIWLGITFGNGLFVAVSSGGFMTSSDGITWTLRSIPSALNWKSIAYGNSKYVCVASSGVTQQAMTSTDGINWTVQSVSVTGTWVSIAYGNGLFVAVSSTGTNNQVITSPDGATWTTSITPANNTWNSIIYANNRFFAVAVTGTNNRVMTATNISPTLGTFNDISKGTADPSFNITPPTSNSTANYSYTSSNTSIATVSGTSLTLGGNVGTSTITALQAASADYKISASKTATLTVKQSSTITNFTIPSKNYGDSPFNIIDPSSNSTGTFSYASSDTSVATILGNTATIHGVGSSTITVSQAETATYAATTATTTFVVNAATPTLGSFTVPSDKKYLDPSFNLTAPSSDSSGTFSYSSSDTNVATISGSSVSIIGAGTTTIYAQQAQDASANYTTAQTSAILSIAAINPTLGSFTVPSDKKYGDASFNLVPPTSTSSGTFSYTASPSGIISISGSTVSILGAGSTVITAHQAQDASGNYNTADVSANFIVASIDPVLGSFTVPSNKKYLDPSFNLVAPTSTNSLGTFSYTSSDPSVASISGATVSILKVGSTDITAHQAADPSGNYNAIDSSAATLTIGQATPTLGAFTVPLKTFGDASFNLVAPTSNSSGTFSYTSSDTGVATVQGSTITIIGAGSTTITATQAATSNFTSTQTTATFTVNTLTPTLGSFTVPSKTFGDASFNLTAPTSNSDGTFSYTSSDTSVATVSGNVMTIVGAGSATITAFQAATANYSTAQTTALFTVSTLTPTLGAFSVPSKTFGDASFNLTAPTSDSNGSFSYTSSDTSVATVSGNVLTIVGGGFSTITATQAATTNYSTAQTTATFTVNTLAPTLGEFTVSSKTFGDASFNIVAPTSNSSGSFSYTSSDTSVATISGNAITIVGAGSSTITAFQAATTNYSAAQTTATFTVNTLAPTLGSFVIPSKTFGDSSFNLVPPSSNSSGTFSYTSSDTSVATVLGSTITIVGGGSATITATQAATSNYTTAQTTATFTVNTLAPTLGAFAVPSKTFGDPSFNLTAPTSNSDGTFSYTSSDPLVATVSGNTITIVGGGFSTITASQAATTNYSAAQTTATFTVNTLAPTLGAFSVPSKTFGDASFNLTAPTSDSNGSFSYTSSDTSVATISGNVLTIVGGGFSTITATQAATANYSSEQTTTIFTVNTLTPTLSAFTVPSKTFGDASFNLVAPTSNSNGSFSYTSSNTDVATVQGNAITIIGAGSSTITATQAATTNYTSAQTTAIFAVNSLAPTLGEFAIPSKTFGDASFSVVPPTSNSSGTFSYTSSDTSVATVQGNVLTIVGGGSSTITALQASTANYTTAQTTATFTVNTLDPTLGVFTVPSKTFGDASFNLTAPTSNSDGTFSYTSSDITVATISGNVITIIGAGSSTITAFQAATTNYSAAQTTATFIVNTLTPTLGSFAVPSKTFGDASFNLVPPTSDSSGTFSYTSSDTSVATISGNVITIIGGGFSTITATQAATTNYSTAQTTATFTVNTLAPTLGLFSVPSKTFGDASFNIVAPTSDSSGTFSYTSSDTSVATISGNVITIVGAGSSTITATQAATTNYSTAQTTATFTVVALTPTLGEFMVSTKTFGDASFNLVEPTSNSSGTFSYTIADTSIATVQGNTITIVGAGSTNITALQAQDSSGNYTIASVDASFTVLKLVPTLTGFSIPGKIFGDAAFDLIDPSSNSLGAFSYASSDTSVATISGNTVTIVGAGHTLITVSQAETANYAEGSSSATFTVLQATPVLSNFSVPQDKIFGDAPFDINAPSTTGDGEFTYYSSNISVATVSGNTVSIVGAGSTVLRATQAETTNYASAYIETNLPIGKAEPQLSDFTLPTNLIFGDGSFTLNQPLSTNLDGNFTYSSNNTDVATIIGNSCTIVGAGQATITAVQEATANYLEKSIDALLIIDKAHPNLSDFTLPSNKIFGDGSFNLVPPLSTSTEGDFSYTSSDTTVATISGNTVSIVGAGITYIRATQAESLNYYSAYIDSGLMIDKAQPILTDFVLPSGKIYGDAPFNIDAPTSNNNDANNDFTYSSFNDAIVSVNGTELVINGAGQTTIRATQAETANFYSYYIDADISVGKADPIISDLLLPSDILYGHAPILLSNPFSTGDGDFYYTSSNTNVASIDYNTAIIVGAGSTTIRATQSETSNFNSGFTESLLSVGQASPALSDFSLPSNTVYGDSPFLLTPPFTLSDGQITYTTDNTAVLTISGTTATIVGAGTANVQAFQDATVNFVSDSIIASITVSQATPNLSDFSVSSKTFGDASFNIIPPLTTGDGEFTFNSSNTAVATISGNTVSIVGAGSTVIRATQAETTNYVSAFIETDFLVLQATPSLSNFSVPQDKVFGDAPFNINAPTTTGDGDFIYTSSNTSVATVEGTTITIVGAGSTVLRATQQQTTNFLENYIETDFTVLKAIPSLSNFSVPQDKIFGTNPFNLTAPSTTGDGEFTYSSSNISVATVSGSTVSIVGAGSTTIRATQAETTNFVSAYIESTLPIGKAQSVLSNFSMPQDKIFGDDSFVINPPESTGDGDFTYTSSNTAVATVSGNTVSIVGAGSTVIRATQASTANFIGDYIEASLTIGKATPILSNFILPSKALNDNPFTLDPPTSTSNEGTFSYTSSDTAVAIINNSTITILDTGITTVRATQAESDNYISAYIEADFTVSSDNPTISDFVLPQDTVYGSGPVLITPPTTNSDGQIVYSSSDTGVASISEDGLSLVIVGAGTCTITATVQATMDYTEASITAEFPVAKAHPIIQSLTVPSDKTYGLPPFDLSDPSSNNPDGTFSYTSSDTSVATIVAGNTVSIIGAGSTTLRATQEETNNYFSGYVEATLTVGQQTTILTNFTVPSKTFGDPSFNILDPSSNNDLGTFSYTSSDTSVATISGNVITIIGAGFTTIQCVQAATANYTDAATSTIFTVDKLAPTLGEFTVPSNKKYLDASFNLVAPTSNSVGTFSYTSSDTSVATVSGNVITIVGAGQTTIQCVQTETANYLSAETTAILVIGKTLPSLSNFSLPLNTVVGDSPITIIAPSSTSNGSFSYTSSDQTVATIEGTTLTIVGAGLSTITALQAETANYLENTITANIRIRITPTIGSLVLPSGLVIGNAPFTLSAPASDSDGEFTFSTLNTDVITISGNTATIVGAGSATIRATQAQTLVYAEGFVESTTTVSAQIAPTLTDFTIVNQVIGTFPFTIVPPVSNSDGVFSYESSNTSVATITDTNVLNIVGLGTTTITATQAETTAFFSRTISTTFEVSQSTLNNPATIANAAANLTYFLNSQGAYGAIISSIESSDPILSVASGKILFTTSTQPVVIYRPF